MADPLITLTTDFGEGSSYVATMKGVVLGINPAARIVDLCHRIPPQDVGQAAYFLKSTLPYFPQGTIHVVVVDPGVGGERALLYIAWAGHGILAPDNGCWTELPGADSADIRVVRLAVSTWWRHPVSPTFHGRDILAPVAAHLTLGLDWRELGTPVDTWVRRVPPDPWIGANSCRGVVVSLDAFGNAITNIPGQAIPVATGEELVVEVGKKTLRGRWTRTYSDARSGTPIVLVSSSGALEIAISQGSAAQELGLGIGAEVQVGWPEFGTSVGIASRRGLQFWNEKTRDE